MSKKTWGVECAVSWCVCLTKKKSPYCAVHANRGKDYRTGEVLDGKPSAECDECGGTSECVTCDGDGEHYCENGRCNSLHECGACEGSGKCPECEGATTADDADSFESRYIAFAFDAGWVPPVPYDNPWDSLA